ncbi:hypothetical protein B0H13DRAFT_1891529 [Mycena leptocephala]|nr:hypothetical protein B0H13DRAFT_1891529 [Mycena leptocephala]
MEKIRGGGINCTRTDIRDSNLFKRVQRVQVASKTLHTAVTNRLQNEVASGKSVKRDYPVSRICPDLAGQVASPESSIHIASPADEFIPPAISIGWIMGKYNGGGPRNQVIAGTITILALALELYPTNVPSVASDLAVGLFHLIQRIGARGLPIMFWHKLGSIIEWGKLIRHSPHTSPELLQKLEEFVPPRDSFPSFNCPWDCLCPSEFYEIVKWLKKTIPKQ